MTAEPSPLALRFLRLSARLLLEYNVRSKSLERRLARIARHVGADVETLVGYREITLVLPDGRGLHTRVPEYRINVAVSAAALHVIDELCRDRIGLDDATGRLESLEGATARHPLAVVVCLFSLAAAAIAWLLRADWGAMAVSGVASGLGLVARRELAKRTESIFVLPFTAGLIGAVFGGVAIRLGWTATPGLCLIVPALMLVPGPHLINSVYDVLENHVQTGLCRLALASGILVATALGVVLGGWITVGATTVSTGASETIPLTLLLDVVLAGVAAAGFGAFYNAPWRVLWVSILCGVAGHGLRYLCLEHVGVELSTLFGCLAVGFIASASANRMQLPFSAIAFAGAVPMMPGVFIYQSIANAMRLSAAGTAADPALAAAALALLFKSVLVVGAMTVGLVVGARLADLTHRDGGADHCMSQG